MRRYSVKFLVLAAVVGMATAAAAQDRGASEPPPSLEYKPPRQVIPEPKAPHPLPPKTVFADTIGGFGMLTGYFDRPVDVARDASGNFYVLDAGNNRVQVFDRFTKFKFFWGRQGILAGTNGNRDSEFSRPSAIAVSPLGFVYVVDTGNNRIQQFDMEGGFVRTWGSLGSREGDFKSPRDIAIDMWGIGDASHKGDVYVLDSGNERVQRFTKEGVFNRKWEASSSQVTGGVFAALKSIALSQERFGYFYLLGAGCLVQQFSLGSDGNDGTLTKSWPAVAPESGLCVPARIEVDDKNNYVYVLDAGNSLLMLFNPDGRYRWALRGAETPFSKPLGFAVDADGGELLVADTENNTVQKFTLR